MQRFVSTLRSALGAAATTEGHSAATGAQEEVGGVLYDLPLSHPQTVSLDDCDGCAARDTCLQPDAHEAYPSYLKLDREAILYGKMKPLMRHVVVSTGAPARYWPSNVEKATLEEATKAAQIAGGESAQPVAEGAADEADTTGALWDARAITVTGMLSRAAKAEGAGKWLACTAQRQPAGEVFLFPEYQMLSLFDADTVAAMRSEDKTVEGADPYDPARIEARVQQFVRQVAQSTAPTKRADADDTPETRVDLPPSLPLRPIPYRAVILICAHQRRDKRCGIAGPILHRRFLEALEQRRQRDAATAGDATDATTATACDDVGVFMVSHTGGHKFAGNVLIYPAGVWYGRVTACHVDAILERTVFGQEIIRELYRGRLNPPTSTDF
ncbi:Sucrase/ferredoxin-like-domain-containing protein [Thamnocephalis sphaerospora]|uniref:Sucrase/ferredoxin-like-domain-containing protein n=1 Tax=Thamnocephalis sphaerospora TaxID=78915 RepID=A0A4P9XSR2_9FUNG|nr:Sucrase/ferredoxin-like-domain-containing protein [Thamnocephalis sphaerospora]|eukprot:RKP09195.1 Sucrase/ferredoxin-like-domain-containing protein [Thamnocephalis sphaerospora]